MKPIFKNTLLALGALALFASCSENSWNDQLDGFEVPPTYSDVTTLKYTLQTADYSTLASLSANVALAEAEGEEAVAALKAIGTNGAFATADEAHKYLPALLESTKYPFYVLNNKSSVEITYNLTADLNPEVVAINAGVPVYAVTSENYQTAWGSDDDFIEAFSPMTPAAAKLPAILKAAYPSAKAGDYVVATYNESEQNPVFGQTGGGSAPTPAWEPTALLDDVEVGDEVTVCGWVTGICSRGFILSDKAGSILCYSGSYDASTYSMGQKLTVTSEISSYGTGLQIALGSAEIIDGGSGEYTYPSPIEYTGTMMDAAVARTGNFAAQYVTFVGTASVGNYINFTVEGAETAQGSAYYVTDAIKSQLQDGQTYRITGYFTAVSSAKYFNVVITDISTVTAARGIRSRVAYAPAGQVASTPANAIYRFDGTKWSQPSNTVVLQPSDYRAMGQSYDNLSGNGPETYLPAYLKAKYPYAAADDEIIVAYQYYNGSGTAYRALDYMYNGSEWQVNNGATTEQFTKLNNVWSYNPSVEITLPYARNTDPSYTYYMACVNWVFENISKPDFGATELTSSPFIDYRGNAEFYSGASAYYGNVDIRATAALNNKPEGYTGYDGLDNDQITLLLKKRFSTEVMPGALSMLFPDMKPIDGMQVTYTLHFTAYTGAAEAHTIVFEVTGPGKFSYLSSTWVTEEESADWK